METILLEWIPVKEQLPEKSDFYIVALIDGAVTIAIFQIDPQHGAYWDIAPDFEYHGDIVTHYMPLPPAPKGEKG